MVRRRLPKYVSEFRDRHGKSRYRFRRKGQDHYFQAMPGSPEFDREYAACLTGEVAKTLPIGSERTKYGTISHLIVTYYGTSDFSGLAASTQVTYRNMLERFRKVHGEKRVDRLERKHVRAILGAMHETPSAANNLLDRLKTLMRLAMDEDLISVDPTAGVKGFRIKSDGFHTWTEEEIAVYVARHPIGTMARLAMDLMLYTGQRRSDAIKMGLQHMSGGSIAVRQQKTTATLYIPMHPNLIASIEAFPADDLTFIKTSFGRPFSSKGFGNWFRERWDEAGLHHCAAHGLRKAAARRLAEAGCSNAMIKSITGHKTDKEVARYVAAAEQKKLSRLAIDSLSEGETGT